MKRLSLLVLLISACRLHAPTLAWDINPELDLAGYRLYYRLDAAPYGTNYVPIIGRTNTSLAVVPSSIGIYSFAVTAVGSNGLESAFSNEITWTNKPGAPKNLRITAP